MCGGQVQEAANGGPAVWSSVLTRHHRSVCRLR
jgi:hypothetical protein